MSNQQEKGSAMIIRKSTVHAIGKNGVSRPLDQTPYNSLLYSVFDFAVKVNPAACVFFNSDGPTYNDSPFQTRTELAKGTVVTLVQE